MLPKARVFITGAGGFLGQAVCRCLANENYEIYRYCIASRNYESFQVGEAIRGESFSKDELVKGLTKARPDFVIHLASAGVIEGDNAPETLFDINVLATKNLVEAVAEVGDCKMIHTGSCSEYACLETTLISETSPMGAPNYYGATKAASVQLFLGLARHLGVSSVVIRPFNLYGPGESMKRLIPYLINQQIAGRECELTHGLQQKDFLYVDDAAKGFVTAIERFDSLGLHRIYNLCSGIPSSLRSIGERIVRLMHGDSQLFRWGAKPARAAEPSFIVGDPSLFMSTTGWQPQTDLDLGLSRTILYHRHQAGRSSAFSSHKAQSAAA